MGIRSVGENVQVSKDCVITGLGNISIGSNVRIDSYNILLAQRGWLEIGSNVHIEPMSSLVAHHGMTVEDADYVCSKIREFFAKETK